MPFSPVIDSFLKFNQKNVLNMINSIANSGKAALKILLCVVSCNMLV